MQKFSAHAVRNGKTIEVFVSGILPNSCHKAQVVDHYPGGNRVYIVDPGAAQVFIEETIKPAGSMCLLILTHWFQTVEIIDPKHDKVSIFLNGSELVEIPVFTKDGQFIVIALTGSSPGNLTQASIIPKDAPYLAIYSKMFGPASYGECLAWLQANSGPQIQWDGELPWPLSSLKPALK